MTKRKPRLNCCATRICSAKWRDCLKCSIPEKKKSFHSASVSMAESRRRWKMSVRTLALRESVFANYRTLLWRSCAARSLRERGFGNQSSWRQHKKNKITHGNTWPSRREHSPLAYDAQPIDQFDHRIFGSMVFRSIEHVGKLCRVSPSKKSARDCLIDYSRFQT